MLFLIRSSFWLGLVFYGIAAAPEQAGEARQVAQAARGAAAACLGHALACAAVLAQAPLPPVRPRSVAALTPADRGPAWRAPPRP